MFEFFRVGLALIAERIALGGLDECWRKAAQIRLQRRNIRMAAFLREESQRWGSLIKSLGITAQ